MLRLPVLVLSACNATTVISNKVPQGRLRITQDAILGCVYFRSVPGWSIHDPVQLTQDHVLGNFQPSLRDFSMVHENPGLRPGLFSAVPTGLCLESGGSHAHTKTSSLFSREIVSAWLQRLLPAYG